MLSAMLQIAAGDAGSSGTPAPLMRRRDGSEGGMALLLTGPPGVGKRSTARALAGIHVP